MTGDRSAAAARSLRRVVVTAAAALMLGAAVPAPAFAQFGNVGDAEAQGLATELSAEVDGAPVLDLDAVAGSAIAPGEGTDSATLTDADRSGLGAVATAELVAVQATRAVLESTAEATAAGVAVDLFGAEVLSVTFSSAAVSCPFSGSLLSAVTELADLRVFGEAVAVVANAPPVVVTGDVTVPGLAGARLRVSLTRLEEVTRREATAVALLADLMLTGDTGTGTVEIAAGTVTLARASCEQSPGPAITLGVEPGSGSQAGGDTVTVRGVGFVPGATQVTFDGVPATVVEVSPDGRSATVITPPAEVGPAYVNASTLYGSDPLFDVYYYFRADGSDAVVTGLAPDTGPSTGGTLITITGTGFRGLAGVTIGGVPATALRYNDGRILATTPRHLPGAVPVVLVFPFGTVEAATFAYVVVPPVAEAIVPNEGPASGGQEVTITGSGFVPGATAATFGGVAATEVTVAADGRALTARTPPGEPGVAEVVVSTEVGDAAPLAYTYLADAEPEEPEGPEEPGGGGGDGGEPAGAVTGDGATGLPRTGAGWSLLAATGAALMLAGAAVSRFARRRRPDAIRGVVRLLR